MKFAHYLGAFIRDSPDPIDETQFKAAFLQDYAMPQAAQSQAPAPDQVNAAQAQVVGVGQPGQPEPKTDPAAQVHATPQAHAHAGQAAMNGDLSASAHAQPASVDSNTAPVANHVNPKKRALENGVSGDFLKSGTCHAVLVQTWMCREDFSRQGLYCE